MDEESNGSFVEVIYLLFLKGHTWPEFLFLYILIQITLSLNFKSNDYFDLGHTLAKNKDENITLAIAKPFLAIFILLLPTTLIIFYIFILAYIASLIVEHLPPILPTFNIGNMAINGEDFKMPKFSIRKMVFEGTILTSLIYLYCYAGLRNKELSDLKIIQNN